MRKRVVQFSFKLQGAPPGLPVVDCRIIPNPFAAHASDERRLAAVRQDHRFESLVKRGVALLLLHDTIAVGCTWGKHRSGAVALEIATRTGAELEHA